MNDERRLFSPFDENHIVSFFGVGKYTPGSVEEAAHIHRAIAKAYDLIEERIGRHRTVSGSVCEFGDDAIKEVTDGLEQFIRSNRPHAGGTPIERELINAVGQHLKTHRAYCEPKVWLASKRPMQKGGVRFVDGFDKSRLDGADPSLIMMEAHPDDMHEGFWVTREFADKDDADRWVRSNRVLLNGD